MTYVAYVLDERTREVLLGMFPPKFPDVYCHHTTLAFGTKKLPEGCVPIGNCTVRGYVCDESLEAIVVEVNGELTRPDGKTFHITLSLDREKGRKPVQSNDLIKSTPFSEVTPYHFTSKLVVV